MAAAGPGSQLQDEMLGFGEAGVGKGSIADGFCLISQQLETISSIVRWWEISPSAENHHLRSREHWFLPFSPYKSQSIKSQKDHVTSATLW